MGIYFLGADYTDFTDLLFIWPMESNDLEKKYP